MVFLLIFALITTLFYINMLISEIYNNKHYPNTYNEQTTNINALIRFVLIILIGIFWGIIIRFW